MCGLPVNSDLAALIERARTARPDFTLTAQNAHAVARICHHLDGIPLAIELAASRIKVLAPEHIAERLDDRFRLLTGGSRTALPRQQTLRAMIDWSYDLLTPGERTLRGGGPAGYQGPCSTTCATNASPPPRKSAVAAGCYGGWCAGRPAHWR